MTQPQAFKCPSCTAALDYDGQAEAVTCDYCGTTVLVPDSWRRIPSEVDSSDAEAANIHEILRLVQDGRKIEAIKVYRETFDVGLKEAKEAVDHLSRGEPTAVYVSTATAATAGSSGCGCTLPIFIMLIMVGLGGLIFYAQSPARAGQIMERFVTGDFEAAIADLSDAASNVNRATYGNPRLADPAADVTTADPDLLLETWVYGGETIPVNLSYTSYEAETDNRRVQWEVPQGQSGSTATGVGVSEQAVFVATETALQAYDRADGAPLWETVLSDLIHSGCETCIQATREQVVVLTADNRLEAFDIQNGRSLWQRLLARPSFLRPSPGYQPFLLVDEWVVVLDALPEMGPADNGLHLIDVRTGELVRLLSPACPDPAQFFDDDHLGHDSQVVVDPTNNTAVFLFGTGMVDQLCLQKWDLISGEQMWGSRLPPDVASYSRADSGLLLAGQNSPFLVYTPEMLLATLTTPNSGNNAAVVRLDLTTDGALLAEYASEGYSLFPIGVQDEDETVLVRAERERGTDQVELWGLPLANTAVDSEETRRWRRVVTAEYLFDLDPFDDRYAYYLLPDGLVLMQLLTEREPATLQVTKLAVATGEVLYDTETSMVQDQWRGLLWTEQAAYLAMYDLIRVDLQDGTAVVAWP